MAAFNESEPTQTLNSTISVRDDVNDIFLNPHLHTISQVESQVHQQINSEINSNFKFILLRDVWCWDTENIVTSNYNFSYFKWCYKFCSALSQYVVKTWVFVRGFEFQMSLKNNIVYQKYFQDQFWVDGVTLLAITCFGVIGNLYLISRLALKCTTRDAGQNFMNDFNRI